jgi:pyridoxal 5'-phosphate synthase pdxT subunit
MKVGVLALQGDVPEHLRTLGEIVPHTDVRAVRTSGDLAGVDALFLPGGESTTIARLLADAGIWTPLELRLRSGFPVLGTCAGAILLSRTIVASDAGRDPPTFGALDARIRRNDYGAQRESFEAPVRVEGLRGGAFPGVFIRAPRFVGVGPNAAAIAWRDDEIVGVAEGAIWGLTFHPELSSDLRVHRRFLETAARRPRSR